MRFLKPVTCNGTLMLHGDPVPSDLSAEVKTSYEKRGIIGEMEKDHPHAVAADKRAKDAEASEKKPSEPASKKKTESKK